jgi:hypothetical protein
VTAVPDWIDALRATPMRFRDNGCSSPFRRFHGKLYPRDTLHAIGLAARIHDAGFSIFRLPGSGWEHVTRDGWNRAYRDCMIDQLHRRVGLLHYAGLTLGSAGPWRANAREMERLGWHTWADYLRASEPVVAAFIEQHHERMRLAMAA